MSKNLDKIHIRDILLRCIIGVYDWEREKKQDVIINITLYADLKNACISDDINETVDYKEIKQKVLEMVESSSFKLVESLAEKISEICLENPKVKKVKVTVDKSGALRYARSVGIEIKRERK